MVHQTVNRCRRGHRVLEDLFPVGEDQVRCDQDAATFVPVGEQSEEHLHFVTAVLNVTDVIDDESVELVESLEFLLQPELGLGPQESLDQQRTWSEVDSPTLQDEFMTEGTE